MTYTEEFETFGQYLVAVMNAPNGGGTDPRLEFQAVAGLNNSIPSEGAFLIPDEYAADLWNAVYDTGQFLQLLTKQPVTIGDKVHVPAIDETSRANGSRFGGLRFYWTNEGVTPTATKPKFSSLTLQPKKLMGLTYVTGELGRDVPALAAWFQRIFGLEAAFEIEDLVLNGDGVGKPLGILNSGAVITVAKESGQGSATVVAQNFLNMMHRLWGASRRNAVWATSNDVFLQAEPLSLSNGAPLVTYDTAGTPRILGRPVLVNEYTPTVGSRGDVVLFDPGQYLLAEKDSEMISSIHARYLYDEEIFKTRWRVDGQPAWKSPVTPNNSSSTQSPFVTLAERA